MVIRNSVRLRQPIRTRNSLHFDKPRCNDFSLLPLMDLFSSWPGGNLVARELFPCFSLPQSGGTRF